MKFYSNTTRGFYPETMRVDYEVAGSWPADATGVDATTEAALRCAIAAGDTIEPDGNSGWVITPAPISPFDPIDYLNSVRTIRDEILNRISGIGFAALVEEDSVTVQGVMTARRALLDMTTSTAVLAATDEASIRAAISEIYGVIVDSTPASLRPAFKPSAL
jgi:hypothetical protein